MLSIFTERFKGLHKNGAPLDLLATWRKTFDKASERETTLFQKMYCDEWFEFNTPQMSLTAEAIVGKYRLRFMATLIGDESPTPLRRSDGFDIWTKEIPRVGHKFPMPARDLRKLLEIYENPRLKEAEKVRQIEKTLKHDMQDAYLGCKDVMDFIILTVFSNWGVCQFTPDVNNPGGRRYEVDYQMSEVIFSLGIFLYLIISSTCADDCSSKTTEATCTGSCKWNAGTEATCKAATTCTLKSDSSGCVSTEGCTFTAASTQQATCAPACASGDEEEACKAKGCTYNSGCVVPTCTVSGNACSAAGCTYTAGSSTAAKCEATATCALNNDKTACASATGCTFTAAVAGSCTTDDDDTDNSNILKVSLISLMFFFSLF